MASGSVRLDALVAACFASVVVGLAGGLGWRWFSVLAMDLPTTPSTGYPAALVFNAVVPVAGNGFGYFMAYRRPSHRSLPLFVVPGVLLAGVGLAVSLAQLPTSSGAGAVVVTVVAVAISPALVMSVLLTRRNLLRPMSVPVDRAGASAAQSSRPGPSR